LRPGAVGCSVDMERIKVLDRVVQPRRVFP
jgi:hypothetical protein